MEDKTQIVFKRVFDAPRETVWKYWTTPELVKKWWGPEHFYAPSIKADFRIGGKYVYAMHGPAETEWDKDMYSAGEYKEIVPMEKLVVTDYFSDENGNKIDPTDAGMPDGMPDEMLVTVLFEDVEDGKTQLSIVYHPENEAMYDAMIKTGMNEGWNSSLEKMAAAMQEN